MDLVNAKGNITILLYFRLTFSVSPHPGGSGTVQWEKHLRFASQTNAL